MFKKVLAAAALFALVSASALTAQVTPPPGGVKRTILQKSDVPGSNYEVIVALVEVPAGFKVGRHTHPGSASASVLELVIRSSSMVNPRSATTWANTCKFRPARCTMSGLAINQQS